MKKPLLSKFVASLFLTLVFCTGCGKTPVAEPVASDQTSPAQQEVQAVVEKFLNAVRSGNDEEVFNMLSAKSREVCGRDRLPSVQASDTAEFKIDSVQLVGETEAQVRTTIIDTDQNGQKVEDPCAWALRKTEEGWRIVGTAFVFVEGMDPVVVNFESRDAIAEAEAQVEEQTKIMAAKLQELNETTNR